MARITQLRHKTIWMAILLLSGCHSETKFQTVYMPPLPQELSLSLGEGCRLKTAVVKVLNHDKRTLSFKYKLCDNQEALDFSVNNQNHIHHKGKSLLVVDSMRNHTPQTYMQAMANNANPERCFPVETPEKLWLLIDPTDTGVSKLSGPTYFNLPEIEHSECGRYKGSTKPEGWAFAFNDGFVFGFKQESVRNLIELSSVTYTDKQVN